MHITSAHSEIPLFHWEDFSFDQQVNLFVGPNASGKSTILRAIEVSYSLEADQFDLYDHIVENGAGFHVGLFLDKSSDWLRWGEVPLLYVPATRVNLPGMHIFDGNTIDRVGRDQADDPLEALFETRPGVFNGYYVEQVINWILRQGTYGPIPASMSQDEIQRQMEQRLRNQRQQSQLRKVLSVGYSCAKCICPEIIRGDTPRNYADNRGMGIMVSDDILDEPLYAGVLSSGTQGTLLWIYALALKMAHHYRWEEGWEKKPAILLIDEIENHLHPTWQRRVIPALLDHFPSLQIFATTHSPFVVAGLKAGQVHLLKRDPDTGAVTATTNDRDIIGWTADEILRNMMGVDEPTDQLTVDRANRLRQLREKETLTSEEESELNALRRQVNADLLTRGGLLEVERERYADLVREFLRSQQSDLTQDGE